MSAALSLAVFLMKLSVFVVRCHVFGIPFSSVCAKAYSYIFFCFFVYGFCAVVDSAKNPEREREIKEREKDRARQKRGTKRDKGGQLPQMQLAHISLVPAFSPADVHHPLNYTSATNLGRI